MEKISSDNYRKDIDGLRAIAVLAVILFHLGYLQNGYLGVDIFFAISGFLITKIVYNEAIENKFSIINFYLRRIRRIIPLVLFTTMSALLIGFYVMLPDDLENLSQSVISTNLFANNILLLITTHNYWDVINEFKPLMHTWSLGVEEQFYLMYPLIFIVFSGKKSRYILPLLISFTVLSLGLFIMQSDDAVKFYLIQYRFFELALGGLGAIIFNDKLLKNDYKLVSILIIILILTFNVQINNNLKLVLVVISSVGVLISRNEKSDKIILSNKIMVGIGKISFSLYMWHQIVLAYSRYFVIEKITIINSIIIFIVTVILSIMTFYIVEQPFRNKQRINTRKLLVTASFMFIITCISSLYIYSFKGIIHDVPELDLYKSNTYTGNIHGKYNQRISEMDKQFSSDNKIKVLIIGNSFARDWANILLESKNGKNIEISYVFDINKCKDINDRLNKSKIIFFSTIKKNEYYTLVNKYHIDTSKVWNVGTKDFGSNNGIFYNKEKNSYYYSQRVQMREVILKENMDLKNQWGKKYIDLIGMIIDEQNTVPVFTPDHKFISQDCRHLTHSGAIYFAKLLDNRNNNIDLAYLDELNNKYQKY